MYRAVGWSLGDECLDESWFVTMAQARLDIEHWRIAVKEIVRTRTRAT